MKHIHYLMSFHGMDIGLVYNLPRNVRIYLYCYPGKQVDATDCNEAFTWYIGTNNNYDDKGKYMKDLKLTIGKSKYQQYCVFSGNLVDENMNRIPDLLFEDEYSDFRTGLFELPVKFNRVFIKDKYSSVDKKLYKPGDIQELDVNKFHNKLKPYIKKNKQIIDDGFISYFITPSTLNINYKKLDFIIVPQVETYNSHIDLCYKTGAPIQKKGIPKIQNKRIELEKKKIRKKKNNIKYDTSTVNTQNKQDIRKILKIKKNYDGLFLSDIVRFLCNKNPSKHITLIISACRSFHNNTPKRVKINQSKTAFVNVDEYLKKYVKKDLQLN